ncbi:Phage capsid scaffolding protein (GPO) serine peptidase [Desulfonatronum zhilinae]|nr:Phage capsid scaffolding protein (GPO) serine peptidase [Desulfonatronum zhilinae]
MQTDQITQEILSSPAFRDLLDKHVADSLAAFVELQEKRAGQASLIERIVRVEEAQRSHEALTRLLLEQINLRFEEMQKYMDSRFEQVEKRFEQIDKRFEQIEKRLEQVDKRFEQIEKRFEQMDKRFEQVDKRFEALTRRLDRFMIWSLGLVASSTALIITILK